MKFILTIAFICSQIGSISFAQDHLQHPYPSEIVVRKKSGKFKFRTKTITITDNRFENSDFKVVLGKSNDAIQYDDPCIDDSIKMKAATTLYHLNRAKQFFIQQIHSPEVKKLEPITVRLELTNQFDQLGHFQNDAKDPQYNNAWSIVGGKEFKRENISAWNREIWFRPEKRIPISEILKAQQEDPLNPILKEIRNVVYPMELQTTLNQGVATTINSAPSAWSNFLTSSLRQGSTLLWLEGGFQVMKLVNRILIPQHYYIDAALVPEIITHEFSHIALSDYIDLARRNPVVEGYADYFAASLDHSPKLAAKILKFNTAISKNGKNKNTFNINYETMANSDFVLSLLWGIRKVLGEIKTDQLIFESRKYIIAKDVDIRTGLTYALNLACDSVCENPFLDHLKLIQYFEKRGL